MADVGRPRTPRVTRARAFQVALGLADERGLDFVTVRTVAAAMEVQPASLYYYFSGVEEILTGAARLAVAHRSRPVAPNTRWQHVLLAEAQETRAALIRHPNLIPFILRQLPLRRPPDALAALTQRLTQANVPGPAIEPLLDTIELLAVSSALATTHPQTEIRDELLSVDGVAEELLESSVGRAIRSVLAATVI